MYTPTRDRLPKHLARYAISQDYSQYTPRNQATWRYILHRGLPFFRKHAVSVYEEGLSKTGLPLEHIPTIEGMDRALQEFGWGAVGVCGFIPPWAFLEFQSLAVLPIATDIRSLEHIGYTPAPDIVHEAAGHAPILVDKEFRDYLQHYAAACIKAIYSQQDNRMFESIRILSDIKEKPGMPESAIKAAEADLVRTKNALTYTSEQSWVARMSWWTAEYGLVGKLDDPKIYGAGLLSSVAESKALYGAHVKKIPLSLDCIQVSYDITNPQPQLFVARDMQHLLELAEELKAKLAYNIGGLYALNLARESEAITTTILKSELAVSGCLSNVLTEGNDAVFLAWSGPCQLSYRNHELPGQGIARHPQGFSCPIGPIEGLGRSPDHLTLEDLKRSNIESGADVVIRYNSGFVVKGKVEQIQQNSEGLVHYLVLNHATVSRGDTIYYRPEWGAFDLPLSSGVNTVYGGPADRFHFGEQESVDITTTPGRDQPFDNKDNEVFALYQTLRNLRQGSQKDIPTLKRILASLQADHPQEWLAQLEAIELGTKHWQLQDHKERWLADAKKFLFESPSSDSATSIAIEAGKVLL